MSEKNQNSQDETIETLMDLYEKKNRELEEREMEARYRLQLLENTMPALMMWNIWRLMLSSTGGSNLCANTASNNTNAPFSVFGFDNSKEIDTDLLEVNNREEDLLSKMRQLEDKLDTQNKVLANCRLNEDTLRSKLQQMENWITGETAQPASTEEQIAITKVFDKLSKMAHERMEMDQRIKDLELREKMFKETLEQADNFIAQMDAQFQTSKRGKSDADIPNVPIPEVPVLPITKSEPEGNGPGISSIQAKLSNLEEEVDKLKEVFTGNAADRQKLNESELERCIAEIKSLAGLLLEERNRLEKNVKSDHSMEGKSSGTKLVGKSEPTSTKVDSQEQTDPSVLGGRNLVVQEQPVSLLGALSSVSTVHVFVYVFMALLVLRKSAN